MVVNLVGSSPEGMRHEMNTDGQNGDFFLVVPSRGAVKGAITWLALIREARFPRTRRALFLTPSCHVL